MRMKTATSTEIHVMGLTDLQVEGFASPDGKYCHVAIELPGGNRSRVVFTPDSEADAQVFFEKFQRALSQALASKEAAKLALNRPASGTEGKP